MRPSQWAAAAIITIALGLAAWFQFIRPKKDIAAIQPQTERFKNDIAPGGNHATLTLANGQKVMLDSAADGLIARQNGSSIIKASGELKYTQAGRLDQVQYNTLATPRGGQYQLTLPDGSRVWLDASSSIRYPTSFRNTERRVEISGQAYFEIAHRQPQPFTVSVNGTETRDIGTAFNIDAYGDEPALKVTLVEGSVIVSKNARTLTLSPNQQAQVKQDQIELVRDADTEAALAWKNGLFQFEGASVATIMNQLSRWYDIQVEYESPISKHFRGTISRNVNVSDVFRMLELTGEVHFKIEGKKITVMK